MSELKILPHLVSSLDHSKLSNSKATNVVLTTLHCIGVDVSKVPVSISTLRRHRIAVREQISNDIKETFGRILSDSFSVLRWDGKILSKWSAVDGKSVKLAIVLSNGGTCKIVGVADLENGNAIS